VAVNNVELRSDGDSCFVCGKANENGLQVSFRMEDGICRAEFTPPAEYCGYDGVTHGGILFSLLDDVMANWLFLQGERAYTGKCEIRFRTPALTGEQLLLEGELISRKGRTAKLVGRARHAGNGQLLAEAAATFVVIPGA
jgi:acyl-coenzyme A thioesterase PaaI-like protein